MTAIAEEKVNILLVDDQTSNLLALESILDDMDLNLVRAESGRAALRALLDREFAVILLDVQMPDLDGFETARLVRERDKSRGTPIIFLTAAQPQRDARFPRLRARRGRLHLQAVPAGDPPLQGQCVRRVVPEDAGHHASGAGAGAPHPAE